MIAVPPLCRGAESTLVMVDIQDRLLSAMAREDRENLIHHGRQLLQAAQALQIPILATEQYPRGLGATHSDLAKALGDSPPLEKTRFSCCGAQGFTAALPVSRPQVVLFGIEAHICVLQTALELQSLDKQVFIAADAIASRRSEYKQNALNRMQQAGIIISNSESIVFEWLGDARHEQFKSLSALFK